MGMVNLFLNQLIELIDEKVEKVSDKEELHREVVSNMVDELKQKKRRSSIF